MKIRDAGLHEIRGYKPGMTGNGAAALGPPPMVEMEVEGITPEIAREMLALNLPKNRKLSPINMMTLAEAMSTERYKINGETIVFDRDGWLVNGQHRLQAVVHSGVGQWMLVVRGVDPDAFSTCDQGVRRQAHQFWHVGYASAAYAALRLVHAYQQAEIRHEPFSGLVVTGYRKATNDVLDEMRNNMPDFVESCRFIATEPPTALRELIPYSGCMFLHWLFAQRQRTLADGFFVALAQGDKLASNDPIWVLRERLRGIRGMSLKKVRGEAQRRRTMMALSIKAWNLIRANESTTRLWWSAEKHPFPTPR